MFKIKFLFVFVLLWSLNGCMSSSNYYVLSVAPQPVTLYNNKHRAIGVQNVSVPAYLLKREIAIAKTSSQIELLNSAVWGEDLDTGLTHRLISFLQKKFNQPSVYAYPWGVDHSPHIKVNLHITRFIAQGDSVYLDANWEVINLKTNRLKSKLFHTRIPTSTKITDIVESMDKAF
ncbi:MAG: hypothetical protein DRQ78_08870, partial [Epsilonproteobacteria bacterium]